MIELDVRSERRYRKIRKKQFDNYNKGSYKESERVQITFKCLLGKALNAAANGYARKSDRVYCDEDRRNVGVTSY